MGAKKYFVLAYYRYTSIEDPKLEVKRHHAFFEGRDVAGRIYISEQGINGQMSGSVDDAEAYMEWIRADERFADMPIKVHTSHENAFARMTVKYREQLCALDHFPDINKGGKHVKPSEWRKMLESDEEYVIIDVRNDYEWEVGHFEGAELPKCNTFREFPDYVKKLKEEKNPKETKVMMYCTGGIRCETYSALMAEQGFEDVYQLEGGVIQYGLDEGNQHWNGKLFVFDDRMTIPISDDEHSTISTCHHCSKPCDTYYNCANMECNELFLCCDDCLEKMKGCCQQACVDAPRVRRRDQQEKNKPFRRLHTYNKMNVTQEK